MAPAKVAKFKPARCTGMFGKRCSCGLIHKHGANTVDTEQDDDFGPALVQAIVGALAFICAGLAIIAALDN